MFPFVGVPIWVPILDPQPFGCGSKPMGSHFGVGEFTTHVRTYFSWDWYVHWGYDSDLTHGHLDVFLAVRLNGEASHMVG